MGEASRAPHRSLGFIGVSSLPSTTTWATGGPSPRGCSRTTTQHLPRSTTKWFVRCWHRRVGSGGGCKDRGVTARGTLLWMGEEEAPAPGAALWVGEGLRWVGQDCWVSPVPPSPPWTLPIHPTMPSLSPLGLFPWGWGEAGALPAPLPSSLRHFLATAAAWPSTAFFPPGAWSWVGGATSRCPPLCAAQSRRAGATTAGGRSLNCHELSMLPSILTSGAPRTGTCCFQPGGERGLGSCSTSPATLPVWGRGGGPSLPQPRGSWHFCSLHLTALLLLLCVLCVRFLPHACWLPVG